MCGIVIGNGSGWTETRINNYLKIIKHRGPDNTGLYNDANLFLGHVRLSIIDTKPESNQPFFYKNLVISYNGEMFNYIEEREILKDKGYSFNTESDTEVIIKMFEAYGFDFIHRVNGMFVISIYNRENKKLFIWRDRFGIKPFYYTLIDQSFVGCSEIKPMLLDKLFDKFKWNKRVLASYIRDTIVNYSKETFYEGILQLEPGCYMTVNTLNNEVKTNKYYALKEINKEKENDAFNKLKSILFDSVKIRMRSDVGFSSALSGGVDSTLITKLMQDNKKFKEIDVFSMLRESKDDYDSEFSLKYKKLFPQNRYTRATPSNEELSSILEKVIYSQEEPFQGPSIVLQNLMYSLMKKSGIKVVLEGQGGDEIFIGYERYLFTDNLKHFLNKGLKSISIQTGLSKKATLFYWFYFRNSLLRKLRSINLFGIKTYLLLKAQINTKYLETFTQDLKNGDIRINEITKFQLRRLLNYGDKNSMANSVEVRLPFLDYRVVESAININPSDLTKRYWSKYLLRTFLDDFGLNDFAWRKNKNGFEAPDNSWNILELYPIESSVEKYFKINSEKIKDKRLKWKLANIRALEKIFNVNI